MEVSISCDQYALLPSMRYREEGNVILAVVEEKMLAGQNVLKSPQREVLSGQSRRSELALSHDGHFLGHLGAYYALRRKLLIR